MRISDWSSDVCSSDLAVAQLARRGTTALYVSGEEAVAQIGLRAQRLGLADAPVMLAAANSLRDILAGIDTAMAQAKGGPAVIVIDTIQTIFADNIESAPDRKSTRLNSSH